MIVDRHMETISNSNVMIDVINTLLRAIELIVSTASEHESFSHFLLFVYRICSSVLFLTLSLSLCIF